MLAYVVLRGGVEETEEHRENKRPWTVDHYPATYLYLSLKPDSSDDKQVFNHCAIKAFPGFLTRFDTKQAVQSQKMART